MDLTWYNSLPKPWFTPPSWVFGPAWTILYVLMAVAAALVWRSRENGRGDRRKALVAFAVQLALNLAWTPLFFGLHRPDLAFADIALLWLAIVATVVLFSRVRRAAAWLLAPYLAWVSFALVLNAAFLW